jgi:flagellar M-ring protein FliF
MSNALATLPPALSQPIRQAQGLLQQPAVKRALPLVFVVGLIAAAALAWMMIAQPPQRVLFPNLGDADKAAVSEALRAANIASDIDSSGALTVGEDDYHRARMLLASQDLPKAAPGGYAILDELPMGVSRAVEGERLRQARETELARSIAEIDAVVDARVHLATPEASVFVRDNARPSASVIVRLEPGRTLSDSQVRSITNLVAGSVPGMKTDDVTIVDQMGALLSSKDSQAGTGAGDARIDYQRRVEDKYRLQLSKLLTPLVGAGNFSAEIQADVDLDENQATRESFDKSGVIRAEQGQWQSPQANAGQQPGGIPGALSNTPPAAATLTNPNNPETQPGAGNSQAGGKASEEYARTYDLGKEVSVSRQAPGAIKRLSVAVLLREPAGAKPRSAAEIRQINELVRAAVGYSQARQDQVTVISRPFSAEVTDADAQAWYDAAWVPMAARNGTALVIALLVLFVGVRPIVKSLSKKKGEDKPEAALPLPAADGRSPLSAAGPGAAEAPAGDTANAPPVSIEMLQSARSYDERVGLVRGFTRDNPTRAALAVRDMIKDDAQ